MIFLEFLKYWPSSHDLNKLIIKGKMHVKTYFFKIFRAMKIQYDFFRETWSYARKPDIFFLFATFQRKPGILIPDLYLYGIKIQTNIK
jgi:hypothetical protein